MKNKILTIRKVNFTGKWVEFWFEEERNIVPADPISEYEHMRVKRDCWVKSYKGWKLHGLVDEAGLEDEVSNNGFIGLKTEWEHVSPNWNIVKIFKDSVEEEDKIYTKYDMKQFVEFLLAEGIVINEEKTINLDFLHDVWSGKNPDGLL